MLDEFEERGLAERRRNPSDRRASAVHLTEDGREQLARALELSKEVERRLLGPLPAAQRRQLHALLKSITGLSAPR
jgi:DNA-binding MarR family transcriptional regulator